MSMVCDDCELRGYVACAHKLSPRWGDLAGVYTSTEIDYATLEKRVMERIAEESADPSYRRRSSKSFAYAYGAVDQGGPDTQVVTVRLPKYAALRVRDMDWEGTLKIPSGAKVSTEVSFHGDFVHFEVPAGDSTYEWISRIAELMAIEHERFETRRRSPSYVAIKERVEQVQRRMLGDPQISGVPRYNAEAGEMQVRVPSLRDYAKQVSFWPMTETGRTRCADPVPQQAKRQAPSVNLPKRDYEKERIQAHLQTKVEPRPQMMKRKYRNVEE